MANPQCENGFTRIANELFDVALRELDPPEFILWAAVVRVTYGYGRIEAELPVARLAAACGMGERNVRSLLSRLAARQVLYTRKQGPKPMIIGPQKDYGLWIKRPAESCQSLPQRPAESCQSRPAESCQSLASYQLEERNKKERVSELPLEALEVAQKYHERIKTVLPSLTRNLGRQADEKGALALDALTRIDGHDWETVKAVLRWALTDEFWARNLRSLASCRTRGKNGSTKFENCLAQYELTRAAVRSHGQPAAPVTVARSLTAEELAARPNPLWAEESSTKGKDGGKLAQDLGMAG